MPDQNLIPQTYTDYTGLAAKTTPASTDLPNTEVQQKPFDISHDFLKTITNQVVGGGTPVYAYDKTDPYSWAERYMTGLGHSGYIGANSEDYNAVRQGAASKWINGIAKGLGNTAATAVSSTVGLLDGLMEMASSPIRDGEFKFSRLYDNFTDNHMQDLREWTEKVLPNYYTQPERATYDNFGDNLGAVAKSLGTANFWADKFVKNAGFAAGAILSSYAVGSALTKLPFMSKMTDLAVATNRALRTGSFVDKTVEMEKAISALGNVDDLVKADKIGEVLLSQKVGEFTALRNADNAFRSAFQSRFANTVGAVGESSMEALEGQRTVKNNLIQQYKSLHGREPGAEDLKQIEDRAAEGANWRWGLNAVTLTITNNIQFPKLLNNTFKNQRSAYSREISDIVAIDAERKLAGDVARAGQTYANSAEVIARGRAMKIANPVWQFLKNPVETSEMVEEGLQYAYEKGTESYEQMKYDGKSANIFSELVTTGLPAMFRDREGVESIFLGGLTGKAMNMTLGRGQRNELKANTAAAIESFNNAPLTKVIQAESEYMKAIRESAIRAQTITQESNKAVANKDVKTQMDLDRDFLFNYALPRITYGRQDLLKEELQQYRSGRIPFEESKRILGLDDSITEQDLNKIIDTRLKQVDDIGQIHDFVVTSYGGINKKTGKRDYTDNTLEKMMFSLWKIADYDQRLSSLAREFSTIGINTDALFNEEAREGKDLDTVRNELSKLTLSHIKQNPVSEQDANGISLINKLNDLEGLQNDRELYSNEYERLRKQTATEKPIISLSNQSTTTDLENYEANIQNDLLVGKLQTASIARILANKMSMALESVDDEDIKEVGRQMDEMENLLVIPGTFLYQDDIDFLKTTTDTIRKRLFDKAKTSQVSRSVNEGNRVNLSAEIPEFINEKDVDKNLQFIMDNTNENSFESDLSQEQQEYLERILQQYNLNKAPLDRMDSILDNLNKSEPTTPVISEIKRQIADQFMESYSAVEKAIENPDYAEVGEVESLLGTLRLMKKLYTDRSTLLDRPAFNGFIDLLDDRIKNAEEWYKTVQKRMADILKDDTLFYQHQITNIWLGLGININQELKINQDQENKDTIRIGTTIPILRKTNTGVDVIGDDLEIRQAETKIERFIETSNSFNTFLNSFILSPYEFNSNHKQLFIPYVKDRFSGKTTQVFSDWRRGISTKGSIVITNLQELLTNNVARITLTSAGEEVLFNTFDVTIDRNTNTAEVAFIEKTNRTTNKGIGYDAYIELGNRLAAHGIALISSGSNAKLPGGTSIWNRLLQAGKAERFGNKGYRYLPNTGGSNISTGHILNKEVYQTVSSIIGEENLSEAIKSFRKDRKAGNPGFEKHLLQIIEQIRLKIETPKASQLKQSLELQKRVSQLFLAENPFKDALAESQKGAYESIISNPITSYDRILNSLFSIENGNSYEQYFRHRDLIRFYGDLQQDIKNDKFDYGNMPAEWSKSLINSIIITQSAISLERMLNSNLSLTSIYDSLKTTITEQQAKNNPTPSDKQLISIIDMILHNYDSTREPGRPYDPIMYLDGRIGAGKTSVVLKYVLNTISNLEGQKLTDIAYLVGDTAKVGANLEKALEVSQSGGVGRSIEDIIQTLEQGGLPDSTEIIVIDEAARAASLVPKVADLLAKYNSHMRKNVVMYLMGDNNQVTGQIARSAQINNLSKNIKFATPLSTSFRGKVASINTLQADFLNAAQKDMRAVQLTYTSNVNSPWDALQVAQNEGLLVGVSGSQPGINRQQKEAQVIRVLKNRENIQFNGQPLSKAIIVNQGKEAYWNDLLQRNQVNPQEFIITNYFDAQGQTFDEVYIDLNIDDQDQFINDNGKLNTAIYTSARGRNYVYLVNNAVNTKQDPGIVTRFLSNSEILKEGAENQLKKVTEIVEELKKLSPLVTTEPEVEVTEEPEAPIQEAEVVTEAPERSPEDGEENPDSTGEDIPEEKLPEEEEPILEQQSISGPVQFTGENIFITPEGRIGLNLSYPQGSALKRYNNLSYTEGGQTISITPFAGEDVFIVPIVPGVNYTGANTFRYGIFRFTGYDDIHQLLGVLSDIEVDQLRKVIPSFDQNDQELKGGTNKIYNPIPLDTKQMDLLTPQADGNTHYTFNEIGSYQNNSGFLATGILPDHARAIIDSLSDLRYNYNPALESSMEDPFHPDRDLMDSLIKQWYDGFFGTTPGAISLENIKRNGKIEITTIDKSRYRALTETSKTGKKPPFSKRNSPVDLGGTYIQINIPGYNKPQFIKLQGAILNSQLPLHQQMYIGPMQEFIKSARTISIAIKDFVRNDMGISDEDFKKIWTSNTYTINDGAGNRYTFHRDNPVDFDTSSDMFNYLVKQMVNWSWTPGKVGLRNIDNNQTIGSFYDKFFVAVEDKEQVERFVTMARSLREAQKAYEFKQDANGNVTTIKLPNGPELPQINLAPVQGKSEGRYRAQVSFINLAQANGSIIDPQTGKRIMMMQFENRKVRAKGQVISQSVARTGYDLLESNFKSFKPILNNQANEDFGYVDAAYQYYTNNNQLPMHINVYQFKQTLSWLINTRQFLTKYESLNALYNGVKKGEDAAQADFYDLVSQTLSVYSFNRLGLNQLDAILGEGAFNPETNRNQANLRINIPVWLSNQKGKGWQSPEDPSSTNPILKVSPQNRMNELLSTQFESVTPSSISVVLNANIDKGQLNESLLNEAVIPGEEETEEEWQPTVIVLDEETNTLVIAPPSMSDTQDGQDDSIKLNNEIADDDLLNEFINGGYSGTPSGNQITQSEATNYLKKFIPNIGNLQVQFLNRTQMIKEKGVDVYGLVRNGAIAFESTTGTVYDQVVKHEAFHAIFRYFTDPAQRNKIINSANEYYGLSGMNPEQIEEFLAKEFDNREDLAFIPRVIRSFFNFLRKLFGIITQHQFTIETYFDKIESGSFKKPTNEPMNGSAYMTKFGENFNNDYNLYKSVWGTFSNGLLQWRANGKQVQEGNTILSIPLSDDEIISTLATIYKRYFRDLLSVSSYEALSDNYRTNLGINNNDSLQHQLEVYRRLSDNEVLKDLIHAHYPDKFRFSVSKEDASQLEDLEGIQEDVMDNVQQENESRKVQNLQAEILKDDEINPRATLSEEVKMFLQTIGDENGNPVPKEFSIFTLFNTIKSISLTDRTQTLFALREAFKNEVRLEGAKHPEWVDKGIRRLSAIGKSFANYSPENRQNSINELVDLMRQFQQYFTENANKELNPNIRFTLKEASIRIGRIYQTLSNTTSIEQFPERVQSTTNKVSEIVENTSIEGYNGNPYTRAIYEAFRSLVNKAFENDYYHTGQGIGKSYPKDIAFFNDNLFFYRGLYIRRAVGQLNYDFLKAITTQVQYNFALGNNDFNLEDLIAIWSRSKSFNTLADIMAVTNNVYTTSPYKIVKELVNGEAIYKTLPIVEDDVADQYNRQMIENLNDILLTSDKEGVVSFNENALSKTKGLLGTANPNSLSRQEKESLVNSFLEETGIYRGEALSYSEGRLNNAATAVGEILKRITNLVEDTKGNTEEFDAETLLKDSKGYLRDITRPVVSSELERNLTVYKNGEGNQVSFTRQKSSANDMLIGIIKYQDSSKTPLDRSIIQDRYPHLVAPIQVGNNQVAFHLANPINPFTIFGNTRIELGSQRMYDSQISGNEGQYVTTYTQESNKDILTRLFIGNFLAPLTQANLFSRSGKLFTIQPFYVISDKNRSEGVDMELVGSQQENIDKHYGQLLFQMMLRPLPSYEVNGNYPFNVSGANIYYSPFRSVSSESIKALRDKYEPLIQSSIEQDKRNGLLNIASAFLQDTIVKDHLVDITHELEEATFDMFNSIQNNIAQNSNYYQNEDDIRKQVRLSTGFQLPDRESLTSAYSSLVNAGVLAPRTILDMSNGAISIGENGIELNDYSGDFRNYKFLPGHFIPLMYAFAVNHYLRGYYLNQITLGDNYVFSSDVKITKRMAIGQGGGAAFFNINNVLQEPISKRGKVKFLVLEDIVMYRNLKETITDKNYNPTLHVTLPEGQEELQKVIEDLGKQSQLTKIQYKNLLTAFKTLGGTESQLEDLISKFKGLSLNKTVVNDAAGFMTQRAHERFKQVAGPGMNVQDIMKPLVHGHDQYGVARNSKFAVEVFTDKVASLFPAIFDLRLQADFGSLNKPETKDLYQEAVQLEKERINLIRSSPNSEEPRRLPAEKEIRLYNLYNHPQNFPAHIMVPESAVKFNSPKKVGSYNYETAQYNQVDHNISSFTLDMRDFRIQQNPAANPQNGAVSLFTQLLYMSNVNGQNYEQMDNMFEAYSELQRIGSEEMNEKYPLQTNLGAISKAILTKNMNAASNLMLDKNESNQAKFREVEAIKATIGAINDPSIVNDVYTQAMAYLEKRVAGVKFNGMKLVQLTPALRSTTPSTESEDFQRLGFEEPKFNLETMTAEVYLPDVFLRQMRKMFPGASRKELIDRIPVTFGWRVPSTGINSAIRIKVKDFYPSKVNAIIGPADMHLIMGSDFDVDSLFVILQDYGTGIQRKILDQFYKSGYKNEPIGYSLRDDNGQISIAPIPKFGEYLRGAYNSSEGKTKDQLRKLYTAYLKNQMLQQYLDILAKPINKADSTYPINFEEAKSLTDPNSLFNLRAFALNKQFRKSWDQAMANGDLFFNDSVISKVEDHRDELVAQNFNVNTPTGYAAIQLSAIGGKNLTGVEANAAKVAAYTTYAVNKDQVITISDSNKFTYDGKEISQIGQRNEEGHYEIVLGESKRSIFPVLQWIVNAVIDNTKEQIAPVMNLTQSTANAWSGALLTGFTPIAAQSFMNLPIFRAISDYKTITSDTIYYAQRQLISLLDTTPERSQEEKYAIIDTAHGTNQENYNKSISDLTEKVDMTTEKTQEYEAIPTISDASKIKGLRSFVAYNLKALEIFQKLDSVGDSFFKLQTILGIFQRVPTQYAEAQNYLDTFFSVYKGIPTYINIPLSVDTDAKERRYKVSRTELQLDEEGNPIVKNSFPIKGINLFNLAHFKGAFTQFKNTHEGMQSTLLKHHPTIENMALIIGKEYKMKLDSDKNASTELLKNSIIKYFLGLTRFQDTDGNNYSMNFDNEAPYRRKGSSYTFTGTQAFTQRFVDKVKAIKMSSEYRENQFINRLKIQNRKFDQNSVTIRKIQGLEPGYIAGLMQAFKDIDQQERSERTQIDTQYWYSPLQVDFLRYALIQYGFSFGSTNYSSLLPTDMKGQLMNQLFDIITAFQSKEENSIQYAKIENDDQEEVTSPITSSDLISSVYQNAGLKIALDRPATLPSIKLRDVIEDPLDAITEENETDQALLQAGIEDKQPTGKDVKRAPLTEDLKYDGTTNTFYTFLMTSENNTGNIDSVYPILVKKKTFGGKEVVYIRVNAYTNPAVKGKYTAYYRKLGDLANAKGTLANIDALLYGYNIKEMFAKDRPHFFERELNEKGQLTIATVLPNSTSQLVLVAPEGDYTMEKAQVYKITGMIKSFNKEAVDAIKQKLTALNQNRGKMNYTEFQKNRNQLFEQMRAHYGVYALSKVSEGEAGIRAIKQISGTLTTEVENRAESVEQLIYSDKSFKVLQALLTLKRNSVDSSLLSDQEIEALAKAITNNQARC
jgi:hypothetical protein